MNIKDIAKKAGVSVATISRVLNDKGVVAPSTRDKVLKIAEEEGYKTSLLGRNLRCRKTNIILVMTPSLSNRFCSKVVRGIEKIAEKEGYFIMVNAAGDSVTRQNLCFDLLRRNFADGMIVLSSVGVDKNLEELSKKHPVVQCSEYIYGIDVPYVSIDNYKAAYEETMHLINGGRKKIAYIGVNNALSSTRLRFKGFCAALSDNGIEFDDNLYINGEYMYKTSTDGIKKLLENGQEFDAVFAISDVMAAGAINALLSFGKRVPEDVSVTGFDNTDHSYIVTPNITTVSQPHREMGTEAFKLLSRIMNGEKTENVILDHTLIVRESTGF